MQDQIVCPSCGRTISVAETIAAQLRCQLHEEFDVEARQKAQLEAREMVAQEVQELKSQLATATGKTVEAQKAELQLRRERRELEEQYRDLELTVVRAMDHERAEIWEAAKQQAAEEQLLKEADRERLIVDLRRQIDVLKRRSEQASPQARGEVMELHLEDLLREAFPYDIMEPVPVGTHGGDMLQRVLDASGLDCGSVLWESKRTKSWSDAWLPKLRDDQRRAKAQLAVLVTEELPKGLATFACIDGVWVTGRNCLLGLAVALRQGLIETARTRRSLEGRQDKVEQIYNYLAGSEFRQRIEGIVESFSTLKDDLDAEKRSMHRLWAKREKQIERAISCTAGLYGDFDGILGSNLPPVANLEIAAIAAEGIVLPLEPACNGDDSPF